VKWCLQLARESIIKVIQSRAMDCRVKPGNDSADN